MAKKFKLDDRLECVVTKLKEYRRKQYDAEWNEDDRSEYYRQQADHYQNLLLNGVVLHPKF